VVLEALVVLLNLDRQARGVLAAMAVELLLELVAVVVEVLEANLAVRGSLNLAQYRAANQPPVFGPAAAAVLALSVVEVAVLVTLEGLQAMVVVEEVVVSKAEMLDQMDLLLQMLMLDNQQLQAHHQELSLLQQQHIQSL
jgi:hypothetical protein